MCLKFALQGTNCECVISIFLFPSTNTLWLQTWHPAPIAKSKYLGFNPYQLRNYLNKLLKQTVANYQHAHSWKLCLYVSYMTVQDLVIFVSFSFASLVRHRKRGECRRKRTNDDVIHSVPKPRFPGQE